MSGRDRLSGARALPAAAASPSKMIGWVSSVKPNESSLGGLRKPGPSGIALNFVGDESTKEWTRRVCMCCRRGCVFALFTRVTAFHRIVLYVLSQIPERRGRRRDSRHNFVITFIIIRHPNDPNVVAYRRYLEQHNGLKGLEVCTPDEVEVAIEN